VNPASLNLQNLRKRAKSVLRQHASGHVPVAERIRRGLPAFAGRSDREVLGASFSLAQAQELVARELGFADWTQLKRSLSSMAIRESSREPSPPPGEPEVLGAHPQIFVTDVERAVAFYRDCLGFACEYLYGDPPFYGLMARGGARLNLRHVDALPFDVAERAREDLLAATIVVRNAKALFLAYEAAGLEFHQRYREQPWGAHDFIVADPDGNLVHFASSPGEG
jgi:catechol 2,3-dioxygenase-like lactoylglutathione lyase family enzyme